MSNIEASIKAQYARFFDQSDWWQLKGVAEHYLETAVKLRMKHILPKKAKLLFRNIQKRLFLGIGCELLLKAYYLKQGYCVNKPKRNRVIQATFPYKLDEVCIEDFNIGYTFTLHELIKGLATVHRFTDHQRLVKGLKIAKAFRNKEGHVVVFWHQFDPQNYIDIAKSVEMLYREGFNENLTIRISMRRNENGEFHMVPLL